MKQLAFFTVLLYLSTSIFGQLKITSGGNLGLGTAIPSNIQGYEKVLEVKAANYSKIITSSSTSGIITGIYANNWTSFPGTLGTGGGYVGTESNHNLYLMANYIPRLIIRASDGHVGIGGISSSAQLYVNGYIWTNSGIVLTSDSTTKKEIKNIQTSNNIKLLRPVEFKWKQNNSNSEKKLSSEKKNDVLEYGFLAQEVRKVYPELVSEDSNGKLGVNYIAFIPLLVDCYKKMDSTIITMQKIIISQEKEIKELKENMANDNIQTKIDNDISLNKAVLFQNNPNPFSRQTEIKYNIPNSSRESKILIFNLEGNLIKQYNLSSNGLGSIIINASEFKSGMYIYSLIIDGKEIDSKRMILTDK